MHKNEDWTNTGIYFCNIVAFRKHFVIFEQKWLKRLFEG